MTSRVVRAGTSLAPATLTTRDAETIVGDGLPLGPGEVVGLSAKNPIPVDHALDWAGLGFDPVE